MNGMTWRCSHLWRDQNWYWKKNKRWFSQPINIQKWKNVSHAFTKLPNRSLIKVEGPEAKSFLQGLASNHLDIITQDPEKLLYTAFFTHTGRIVCDAFMYARKSQDQFSYLVEFDSTLFDAVFEHLNRYKLRVKATLEDVSSQYSIWSVLGPNSGAILNHTEWKNYCFQDPRVSLMGFRLLLRSDQSIHLPPPFSFIEPSGYDIYRTLHGIPEGCIDIPSEHSFPFECTLEYLNAIHFKKGCYLGQELTARTHYTGVTRKRLFPLIIKPTSSNDDLNRKGLLFPQFFFDRSSQNLPPLDTPFFRNKKQAGKIHSSIKNVGIGMVRMEYLADNVETTIFTTEKGEELQIIKPHWFDKYIEEERVKKEKIARVMGESNE